MIRVTLSIIAVVFVTNSPLQAQDDEVKKTLDKGKETYRTDLQSHAKSFNEWLDRREDTARKSGDKKQLDLVKADREAFKTLGTMPRLTPDTLKTKPNSAKVALESVYKNAIKEYTKLRKDELADAVEKEYDDFRAGKLDLLASGTKPPKVDVTETPIDPKPIIPKTVIVPKPVAKVAANKIVDTSIWKTANSMSTYTVNTKEGCVELGERQMLITTSPVTNVGVKFMASFSADASVQLNLSFTNKSYTTAIIGSRDNSKLVFGKIIRSQNATTESVEFEADKYYQFQILADNNTFEAVLDGKSISKKELLQKIDGVLTPDAPPITGPNRFIVQSGTVKLKEITLVYPEKKK